MHQNSIKKNSGLELLLPLSLNRKYASRRKFLIIRSTQDFAGMNIMSKLLAGFLVLILSFTAMAERPAARVSNKNTYLAFGVSSVRLTESVGSVSPFNIYGRLGHDFNRYIGIGFEGGGTLLEDDFQDIDFGINTLFGYLRLIAPIGDKSKIYAMVGPSNVKLTASIAGSSIKVDDDDTAYGIGFERDFDGYGMTIDYISYYSNQSIDVEGFSIGLIGYF